LCEYRVTQTDVGIGAEQARVHDLTEAGKILDTFTKYGHNEIDTARVYGGGSSEEYLGKLDWQKRGIVMDTKFSPRQAADPSGIVMNHSPEGLREAWKRSSAALKTDKVDMWYLHAPDRSTPYEVTMKEVNEMYKEGISTPFLPDSKTCTNSWNRKIQTLRNQQLCQLGSGPNLRTMQPKRLGQALRLPRRL